jgi:hypothetical protein
MQRLSIVDPQPSDSLGRFVTQVAAGSDGTQSLLPGELQDAVDNLTLQQVTEEGYVLGYIKQIDQTSARAQ